MLGEGLDTVLNNILQLFHNYALKWQFSAWYIVYKADDSYLEVLWHWTLTQGRSDAIAIVKISYVLHSP